MFEKLLLTLDGSELAEACHPLRKGPGRTIRGGGLPASRLPAGTSRLPPHASNLFG